MALYFEQLSDATYYESKTHFGECRVMDHIVEPFDRFRSLIGLAMLAQVQMGKLMGSVYGGVTSRRASLTF